MISQIFHKKRDDLQRIAKEAKNPYERASRLILQIVRAFNMRQIFDVETDIEDDYIKAYYAFLIDNDTIYFEGIAHHSEIREVVALNLKTGKYTVVDVDEYYKRYWANKE